MPRTDKLAYMLSPKLRFLWGMCLLIPLFFSESLYIKAGLVIISAILARLAGKRISIRYFFFFTLGICFFQILTPTGEELFSVAGFPVTQEALFRGLKKALTLVSAVFISLFSISKDLQFPGELGKIIAQMFKYLEGFFEVKNNLKNSERKLGNYLFKIDASLLEQYTHPKITSVNEIQGVSTKKGLLLAIITTLILYTSFGLELHFL